jgi:cytochrome c oxidase subunit I+III
MMRASDPPVAPGARLPVIDAGRLPTYAFGNHSLVWWGTIGLMAIEGMVFALAIAVYFYVWTRVDEFPPRAIAPDLVWGVVNTAIMLLSLLPNQWAKSAAERRDLRAVRIALVMCIVLAFAFLGIRALEFTTLNVRWDTNAYGSIVWILLALHTTHLLTDTWDTVVLGLAVFDGRRVEGKRFVDVSENAFYWYFVVASWLPIWFVIYIAPRLLQK